MITERRLYMLFIVFLIALAVLGPSYWAYDKAFSSRKTKGRDDLDFKFRGQMLENKDRIVGLIRDLKERPFEEVETVSFDGMTLRGSFYHQNDSSPVAICFHGWNGTARRDFSGGAAILLNAGYNVILVDERGQGKSDGQVMSFGINERRDVQSWAEYAFRRFGPERPVFLVGVSMGAAAVLMAADLPLPESVKGIIADSPYDSPYEIIEKVAVKDLGLPKALMFYAKLGAKVFGRFDLEDIKASDCLRRSELPVLIVHGLADGFVPAYMSKKAADVRPDIVKRITFEGAEHGMSFIVDPARYRRETLDFLSEILDRI